MTRLPSPYGDCTRDGKDEHFIYPNKNYSTEVRYNSFIVIHWISGMPT